MKIKRKKTQYRVVLTWRQEGFMSPERAEYFVETHRGEAFAGVQAASEWKRGGLKSWHREFYYLTSVKVTACGKVLKH